MFRYTKTCFSFWTHWNIFTFTVWQSNIQSNQFTLKKTMTMTVHETLGKVQEETWGNTYQQEQWGSEWSRAEPSRCQDERSSCVRQTDLKIIRRDCAHSKHTTHWAELNSVQAHAEIQIMLYNVQYVMYVKLRSCSSR